MAEDPKKKPLDPVSLSTWARLRSAGKAPIGGKPYGAEMHKPKARKRKKSK
jgi:hypothetical protein